MNRLKHRIASIPTPMAGLALGISSLGWSWDNIATISQGEGQLIGAGIGGFLLLLLAFKFLLHPKLLWDDLTHPVVGSVVPTFAMALMIVSNSIAAYHPGIGLSFWLIAIVLHLAFLTTFIFHRSRHFELHHMLPSWFVPPVGIIVAAVSFPGLGYQWLAAGLMNFGLLCYAVMLPIMMYRLIFCREIPDTAKPTIAILAAPASLSLAGYLTITEHPSLPLVALLASIALLMTGIIYLALFRLLRLPFSPGFAAFTFPLVIGATALFKTANFLKELQLPLEWSRQVEFIAQLELVIATAIVSYVGLRYFIHQLQTQLNHTNLEV